MSRMELLGTRIEETSLVKGNKFDIVTIVPPDNYPVTPQHPQFMLLNPAAAVDILMPVANEANKGLWFAFHNLHAANVVTLKTDADVAFSPAITVAVEAANAGFTRVICTGTTWKQW